MRARIQISAAGVQRTLLSAVEGVVSKAEEEAHT